MEEERKEGISASDGISEKPVDIVIDDEPVDIVIDDEPETVVIDDEPKTIVIEDDEKPEPVNAEANAEDAVKTEAEAVEAAEPAKVEANTGESVNSEANAEVSAKSVAEVIAAAESLMSGIDVGEPAKTAADAVVVSEAAEAEVNTAESVNAEANAEESAKTEANAEGTVNAEAEAGAKPGEKSASGVYYDAKAFEKQKKKGKAWKIALLIIFLILVTGYGVMTGLSIRYFQMNTVINGEDFSFRDPNEVQEELDEKKRGYQIHIALRNGDIYINPSDMGFRITTENDIRSIKNSQNPFLWFMGFFQNEKKAVYNISYDEKKLEEYLSRQYYLKEENMAAPTNPTITFRNGEAEIVPGTEGTTIDSKKVIELVKDMIPRLERELDAEKNGCYIEAKYKENSPAVVKCKEDISRFTNLMLIYQMADINIQLKPQEIYALLNINLDEYFCVVSKIKVEEFVNRFADEYDTYGTIRKMKTHDGKWIKLEAPNYGWEIDREEESLQLYRDLCSRNSFMREPICKHTAYAYSVNRSDIGDTYVEVDLSNQKAYFFLDNKLIKSCDIISGLPSRGNDTPGGFYTLYGGYMDVVLRGPGYASHVDYWMPFNGGIGLHDASWQSKFGGDLFKTRGSHGCVNLEYDMAKTVYEYCYKGMSVVCYWRNQRFMIDPADATDTRIQQYFGL